MDRRDLEPWKGRDIARLLALVETERRYYQQIVASFPIGAAIVSRRGALVFANRAFRKLTGTGPGESQAKTLEQVLPSPALAAAVEDALRSPNVQSTIPIQLGSELLNAFVIPLEGWEGDPHPEALIALEAPGARAVWHPAQFGDWPALLWSLDPGSLQYLSVDGAPGHFLGYSPLQWTSDPGFWRERIHPDDRDGMAGFYRSAIRKGGEFGCEYRAVTARHETVWCRDSFRVVLDANGTAAHVKGVTLDITTRRRLEQDHAQAHRLDALATLSRRLAHELNNSLMIVTGYAEELAGHMDDDDLRRSDVKAILAAADTMAGITGELAGFTRRQASAPAATDIAAVLAEAGSRIRSELETILVLRQPGRRLFALADPAQLEAVLMAIARRLRDKNGSHMTVTAVETTIDELSNLAHALKPGRYVEIEMRGPFLCEVPQSSFEALLSGNNPHASDIARAYAVVREWGGTIAAARTRHTSEVHVLLPAMTAVEPASEPAAPRGPVPQPAPVRVSTSTILVVEDEKGIRGLIQKILKREGYNVLVAGSADEAEQVAGGSPSPIRLLITDLNLGSTPGSVVADRLSSVCPDVRILYISGYTEDPELIRTELGPDAAFLQKPFTLAALTRKVREILNAAAAVLAMTTRA